MSPDMTDRPSFGVAKQTNVSEPEIVTFGVKMAVKACLVIQVAVFLITTWILLSMIMHGRKLKKWNFKTTKGKVFISAFISIALGMPRFGLIFIEQIVTLDDRLCEITTDVEFVLTCLPMMTTYLFLWIRQRTLRHNEFVKTLLPKWVNYASNCLFPVVFISFAFMIVLYTYPADHLFHDLGCEVGQMRSKDTPNYFGYVTYGSLFTMQILFVILFVYPMILIIRRRDSEKDRVRYKQQSQLVSKVKRYIICSVIVVISDFSPLAFSYIRSTVNPYLVTFTRVVVNLDVLVNQLCMLGTFDPFIPVVFFCLSTVISKKPPSAEATSLPNVGAI